MEQKEYYNSHTWYPNSCKTKRNTETAKRQKVDFKAFVQIKLKHRHRNVEIWQAVSPLLILVDSWYFCLSVPQREKVTQTESMLL